MGDRFPCMDMTRANNECRSRDQVVFANCPSCMMRVGLHCSDCKIQVTGCLDLEIERFGQDKAWLNAVERYGEELARDHYRKAGLYVPEQKKLILPGEE